MNHAISLIHIHFVRNYNPAVPSIFIPWQTCFNFDLRVNVRKIQMSIYVTFKIALCDKLSYQEVTNLKLLLMSLSQSKIYFSMSGSVGFIAI